jgi:His-Xaa-Ser system protein HxsD
MASENIEIDKKDNMVAVTIDPKIYPLDTILSAAYVFIDDAYIIITGDPTKEVVVKFKGKNKCNLVELGRNFNNELLNYAFYLAQTIRTMPIRTAIVQRAFFTQASKPVVTDSTEVKPEAKKVEVKKDIVYKKEPSYKDDPYGIAKPYKGGNKVGRSKKRRE